MPAHFANFDAHLQSWYVACPARSLKRKPRSLSLLNRKVTFWRDSTGTPHALDARCPHLGADLGDGDVVDNHLRCAFHHWQFDAQGHCPQGRQTRAYPTLEKWNLLWFFNGPTPTFDLPNPPGRRRVWRLPRQFINCHPHLVIGNGLDPDHFEALHGLKFSRPPTLRDTPHGLSLEIAGRPTSPRLQFLTGTRRHDLQATFTTLGGNLAWLQLHSPLTFEVLFTALPQDHGCQTQTLLFLPRNYVLRITRALIILYTVLADDHRILNHLQFHPGWTCRDEPLRRFAEKIDQSPIW